jgi:transposase
VSKQSRPYPPQLRMQAIRMVNETTLDYRSQWATIKAVALLLGIGSAETLRRWVRIAESEGGVESRRQPDVHAEIRRLQRENDELRRANEVLRAAPRLFDPATVQVRRYS